MQRLPLIVTLSIASCLLSGCEFVQMEADTYGYYRNGRHYGDFDAYGFPASSYPNGEIPRVYVPLNAGGYTGPAICPGVGGAHGGK